VVPVVRAGALASAACPDPTGEILASVETGKLAIGVTPTILVEDGLEGS
jgi:hypothetical protein